MFTIQPRCVILLLLCLAGCVPTEGDEFRNTPYPAPISPALSYPAPGLNQNGTAHIVGEIAKVVRSTDIVTLELVPAMSYGNATAIITADTRIHYEGWEVATANDLQAGMPIDVVGTSGEGGIIYATDLIILNPTTAILPTAFASPQSYPIPLTSTALPTSMPEGDLGTSVIQVDIIAVVDSVILSNEAVQEYAIFLAPSTDHSYSVAIADSSTVIVSGSGEPYSLESVVPPMEVRIHGTITSGGGPLYAHTITILTSEK